MSNSITVFSNGIADFVRKFKIEKGKTEKIKLSVKKAHVGDLLASFNLYGSGISLSSPPSFPTDAANVLSLDTENVLLDIANKLSGSEVIVKLNNSKTAEGTLIGTDVMAETDAGGRTSETKYVVLNTGEGIRKFRLDGSQDGVRAIEFKDEAIKKEVERALNRNMQKIKPDSVVVELEVTNDGEKDAEAHVQYAVPAAAWKISYRLNATKKQTKFKGLAVIDNNTEENWDDVVVSVVTGEPITFSTDIAEAKIPRRKHVNIVKDAALGAVELESLGMESAGGGMPRGMRKSATRAMAFAACASPEDMNESEEDNYYNSNAITAQADVKEVGDFCIFTAKDSVSIAAHSSAVIPVIDAVLAEANTVLHYREGNHPNRPYRSIEFKNETTDSLERGVCTINVEGIYSGSCIVPAMKPGERQLLPYALETGVKVKTQQTMGQTKAHRLVSKKGSFIIESIQTFEREYTVENMKDETFKFYLENPKQQVESTLVATVSNTKAKGGPQKIEGTSINNAVRYDFDLKNKESVLVRCVETFIYEQKLVLADAYYSTLYGYIINDGPLSKLKGIESVLKAVEDVDKIRLQSQEMSEEVRKLTTKQDRLRKNIGSSSGGETATKWQQELDVCEERITEIEDKTLPDLRKKEQSAIGKVIKALQEIASDKLEVSLA